MKLCFLLKQLECGLPATFNGVFVDIKSDQLAFTNERFFAEDIGITTLHYRHFVCAISL